MIKSLQHIDGEFNIFIKGLIQRNIYDKINLLIVSDHGMQTSVPLNEYVFVDKIIPMKKVFSFDVGSIAFIRPKNYEGENNFK